jgi:hypothetical protein
MTVSSEMPETAEILEALVSDITLVGGTCATCGNFYDKAFTIILHDGASSMFDSIECAAMWAAPSCAECGVRILGHGLESEFGLFCCANCATSAGESRLVDRVDADDLDRLGEDADG